MDQFINSRLSPDSKNPLSTAPLSFPRAGDRKRFQALLCSSGGAVVVVDGTGKVCFSTSQASLLFACKAPQLEGNALLSWVHRRDLYQVKTSLERLIRKKKERVTWIFRLLGPNGRWRWLKATAMRFAFANEQVMIAILLQDLPSH